MTARALAGRVLAVALTLAAALHAGGCGGRLPPARAAASRGVLLRARGGGAPGAPTTLVSLERRLDRLHEGEDWTFELGGGRSVVGRIDHVEEVGLGSWTARARTHAGGSFRLFTRGRDLWGEYLQGLRGRRRVTPAFGRLGWIQFDDLPPMGECGSTGAPRFPPWIPSLPDWGKMLPPPWPGRPPWELPPIPDGCLDPADAGDDEDVRVLVLTHPDADLEDGLSRAQRILNAQDLTNVALANSGVGGLGEVVLVDGGDVEARDASDLATALLRLTCWSDTWWPGAHVRRDAEEADLVCLVVPDGGDDGLAGLAWQLEREDVHGPFARKGFMVVRESGFENLTFCHEIGHLFGCGHNADTRSPEPECARAARHGYAWISEGGGGTPELSTLMRSDRPPGLPLPDFGLAYSSRTATPDLDDIGTDVVIGDEHHDNARIIRDTWSKIANLRRAGGPSTPPDDCPCPEYAPCAPFPDGP